MGKYKFYNEERKKQYIKETKGDKKDQYEDQMNVTFNSANPKEEALGKDICDFNKEEYLDFLKSLNTASFERLKNIVSQLNRYTIWCSEHELRDSGIFSPEKLDMMDINSCLVKKDNIISREELINDISILPISDQFLVLGLFEGIDGVAYSDFQELTIDDFENIDGTWVVHLPGRDLTISDKLYEIAKDSSTEHRLYRYAEGLTFDTREYKKSKKIIKDVPQSYVEDERRKGIRIKNKLSRVEKYLNEPKIKRAALIESGRVDMVKRLYEKEKDCNIADILKKYNKELSERYGQIQSNGRWILKYENYIKETKEE